MKFHMNLCLTEDSHEIPSYFVGKKNEKVFMNVLCCSLLSFSFPIFCNSYTGGNHEGEKWEKICISLNDFSK